MSHPVAWSKRASFYPIGSSAPVDLLQGLPPEEHARALLLGCGDPRSILYSLYNRIPSPNGTKIDFDVTCCDIEPAVLARNALLLTLIADGCAIEQLWGIFFHYRIDTASQETLLSQCDKLMECSITLESWQHSKYSSFLRFCDQHTLSQLRHFWKLYVDARNYSKHKVEELEGQISMIKRPPGRNNKPMRAAGMFDTFAQEAVVDNYEHFWKTGIVDIDAQRIHDAAALNPTFFHSSTGNASSIHHDEYPLCGFFLSEAFGTTGSKKKGIKELVDCARGQLGRWSKAFKLAISGERPSVRIRLFAGDALPFCQTLHAIQRQPHLHSASQYVSSWSHTQLVLDGQDYGPNATFPAPLSFNVIETGDLMDGLGIINIMISAVPLLSLSPWSTIFTEMDLFHDEEEGCIYFFDKLCTDIPTFAVVFGVTPTSYLAQFTTHSNIHDIIPMKLMGGRIYTERLAWKIPSLLHEPTQNPSIDNIQHHPIISMQHDQLAKLVFGMYQDMLASENTERIAQRRGSHSPIVRYNRGTLVALMSFIKGRISTNWEGFLDGVFDLVIRDRVLGLSLPFVQDFCAQLLIRGIYSEESLRGGRAPSASLTSQGPLRGWKDIPPLACLVFVIPRAKIHILENDQFFISQPAILQLGISCPPMQHYFSCVQFTFGSLSKTGTGEDTQVSIIEDAEGLKGKSDLIASVWIAPHVFSEVNFSSAIISLNLNPTYSVTHYFTEKLNPQLSVFTAKITDSNAVFFVKERPGNADQLRTITTLTPTPPPQSSTTSCIRTSASLDDDHTVSVYNVRYAFTEDQEKRALADGARCGPPDVLSMSSVRVPLGNTSKNVPFPFAMQEIQLTMMVARESGYVQMSVPPARLFGPLAPFPLSNLSPLPSTIVGAPPVIWNAHKINLSKCPVYTRRKAEAIRLNPALSIAYSDRERFLRERGRAKGNKGAENRDVLTNVKDSIMAILTQAFNHPDKKGFDLRDAEQGGPYCVIYVNDIKLDLPNQTIVADCFILPISSDILDAVGGFDAFKTMGHTVIVFTQKDETRAWNHLLPTFVERCRTWSHKPTCDYRRPGINRSNTSGTFIPVSDKFRESPICRCGRGIGVDLNKFMWGKNFAPYVTRAAISQLFALSYLESIAGKNLEAKLAMATVGTVRPMEQHDITYARSRSLPKQEKVPESCANCNARAENDSKLLRCGRCRLMRYCGVQCQKAHWKEHRIICEKLTQAIADGYFPKKDPKM